MNKFLKSKQLYMSMVLPFLVLLLTFTGNNLLTTSGISEFAKGGSLSLFSNLDPIFYKLLGGFLICGIIGLLFWVNERYRLLQQKTTLPMLLYVLLVAGVIFKTGWNDILLATLIFSFALDRLQLAINNIKSNGVLFDFGATIVLAVLVYPKLIFCVVWAFCATVFGGRSTVKDMLALFLGFITPLFFLAFYYFWTDRLLLLPEFFSQHWVMRTDLSLSWLEWVRWGVLLFVFLVSFIYFLGRNVTLVLIHRRMLFALVSLFCFLLFTCLLWRENLQLSNYLLALPLSLIYAYFLLDQRSKLVGNLVFILLLVAAVLPFVV